jgi:hypothetical protein
MGKKFQAFPVNEQNLFVGWVTVGKFESKKIVTQTQNFFQHSDQKPNSQTSGAI